MILHLPGFPQTKRRSSESISLTSSDVEINISANCEIASFQPPPEALQARSDLASHSRGCPVEACGEGFRIARNLFRRSLAKDPAHGFRRAPWDILVGL